MDGQINIYICRVPCDEKNHCFYSSKVYSSSRTKNRVCKEAPDTTQIDLENFRYNWNKPWSCPKEMPEKHVSLRPLYY